jgi:RHS repeat-associated protein
MGRPSFTDRRRARLALRVASLEAMERRSMVSESLGIFLSGVGVAAGGVPLAEVRENIDSIPIGSARRKRDFALEGQAVVRGNGVGLAGSVVISSGSRSSPDRRTAEPTAVGSGPDWLTFAPDAPGSAAIPDGTASLPGPRRGGAGGDASAGAAPASGIAPFVPSRPVAFDGQAIATPDVTWSGVPPRAFGSAAAGSVAAAETAQFDQVAPSTGAGLAAGTGAGSGLLTTSFGAASGGADAFDIGLLPEQEGGGAALASFTNFPLYTLNWADGSVFFPDTYQWATIGGPSDGWVELRAQVRDTTVSSYSWNTTNLTQATNITGTSTYKLRFKWATTAVATTNSVTLTVTDINSDTEVQTYYFRVPVGTGTVGSGGGPTYTWPNTLPPDTVVPNATAFASHQVDVAASSGALETELVLPGYSPNFAPLTLRYDSLAADPRPIIVIHHEIDPSLAVPSKTSAQLTYNSVAGSTYYYDTSVFTAGDVAQFALQKDATALSTGRYAYTATVVDYRATNTTATYNGNSIVVSPTDEPFNALGKGWSVDGLNRIYAVTGGVILYSGSADALWFVSSGGGYTSPAGDFSTLVKNFNNTYTRTLKDGTKQEFDTSGYQTAVVDRNGLRVTYSYDGSNRLSKITDPYSKVTTFTYSSGKLQAIEDPANRLTTFSFTGSSPTGVTLPDGSAWAYAYDGSGRMTGVTDPRSKVVTIQYDSANRVGTITRPDSSSETFAGYQVRGYDTSGTSGSPAPAILLAEAAATHTDPRGNATDLRTDWRGLGVVNQLVDPDGYIATRNLDTNGLATVTIDRLNRISRDQYDSKGNVTKHTYPDDNTEEFAYNSFAQVTQHKNARGYFTTYTYDGEGNQTEVRDALGNRTTMTYTANGRVETVKDARSNVTTQQYDSQDRLTTITFPGSVTRKFAYDSKGNRATVTDERGNSTTYSYDALNRQTGMTDALSNRTTSTYDSGGNLTRVDAPVSRTISFAYDSMNRLTTITDPLSHVTVNAYDSGGNLVQVTDPLSRITTYEYDVQNRRTVVIDPLGNRATTTYDAEDQVTRVADRLNRVTTYNYNSRGWVATQVDPLGNTTTYTYTATGKISAETNPASGGSVYSITYDELDRVVVYQDGLSHAITTTYDAVGNVTAKVDANGNRTTYTYDSRNRVETVKDALSHVTTFQYDDAGNRTVTIDPLNHRTTVGYDALNRVTTITDALSGVTTMVYDAAGRRTGLTDPVGNRTTWAYDAADRLTTMTDALGTATYSYDNADQLTDQTDRAGRRTTFAYDSGGRRTHERWLDGGGSTLRTITYTYDAEAQLTGVTDPDATLTFTYDSGGRPITAQTSGGGSGQPSVTLTSGYNASGDRTSLTDNLASVGRTTYSYDAAHRLTTITRSIGGTAGPQILFGYDAGNRRTSIERTINGNYPTVNTTLSYDAADRVTTITHGTTAAVGSPPSFITTPLATYSYGYDNTSRLTSETNAEGSVTYSYDNTDQLTGVSGARAETYTYDANGNRTMTGYSTGSGNRLTASPGTTYTYDTEGNLSAKTESGTSKVTTYAYDHRNRLTGVTQKNSGGSVIMQATYTYDALDRRIGTKVDADGAGGGAAVQTWMVYDGDNTYGDFNGSGNVTVRYLNGAAIDELLGRADSGGTAAWYLSDRLGTIHDVISTSGTALYHAAYDSFGSVTSETGAGGDRFKYIGREYDPETGMYYYRARYYDTSTGRFIGQDPISFASLDTNLYRYTWNNPLNYKDPSGNSGTPSQAQTNGTADGQAQMEAMQRQIDAQNAQIAALKADFARHLQQDAQRWQSERRKLLERVDRANQKATDLSTYLPEINKKIYELENLEGILTFITVAAFSTASVFTAVSLRCTFAPSISVPCRWVALGASVVGFAAGLALVYVRRSLSAAKNDLADTNKDIKDAKAEAEQARQDLAAHSPSS